LPDAFKINPRYVMARRDTPAPKSNVFAPPKPAPSFNPRCQSREFLDFRPGAVISGNLRNHVDINSMFDAPPVLPSLARPFFPRFHEKFAFGFSNRGANFSRATLANTPLEPILALFPEEFDLAEAGRS